MMLAMLLPSLSRPASAQTPRQEIDDAERALASARRDGRPPDVKTWDTKGGQVTVDGVYVSGADLVVARTMPVMDQRVAGFNIYGDLAVVFGAETTPAASTHTLRIWVKRDTGWRLLASHQTPLFGAQPRIRIPDGGAVDEEAISADDVREAEHARAQAIAAGDRAMYRDLLGNDYASVDASGLFMTKVSEPEASRTYEPRRVVPESIEIVKGAAVVRGAESLVGMNGHAQGLTRFTRVWVRRGGRYVLVAQQSTTSHDVSTNRFSPPGR